MTTLYHCRAVADVAFVVCQCVNVNVYMSVYLPTRIRSNIDFEKEHRYLYDDTLTYGHIGIHEKRIHRLKKGCVRL